MGRIVEQALNLSRQSYHRTGFDDGIDDVRMRLMPKIEYDIERVERVLREYDILGENSGHLSWTSRIQKALRKMTWNQDRIQGYLDSLTSNVSELKIMTTMCMPDERLMPDIRHA
jgi:hypothetical protein